MKKIESLEKKITRAAGILLVGTALNFGVDQGRSVYAETPAPTMNPAQQAKGTLTALEVKVGEEKELAAIRQRIEILSMPPAQQTTTRQAERDAAVDRERAEIQARYLPVSGTPAPTPVVVLRETVVESGGPRWGTLVALGVGGLGGIAFTLGEIALVFGTATFIATRPTALRTRILNGIRDFWQSIH